MAKHPPVRLIPPEKVEVAPSPMIVVVEVCPIKRRPKEEKDVEEALLNLCRAVQTLALAGFKEATTAPVVGEMVREPSELETEETAPPPAVRQEPLISLKQPPEREMPPEKVEVAAVPKTSRYEVRSPAARVEVAVVEVALR